MPKKGYDKFQITGNGNSDIHNIHSYYIEAVVLLSRVK